MAESIAILFESVAWDNLEKDLSKFSENVFGKNWVFPSNHSSQTLSLYEYDSWLNAVSYTHLTLPTIYSV